MSFVLKSLIIFLLYHFTGSEEMHRSHHEKEPESDPYLSKLIRLTDELTDSIMFAKASGFHVSEVPSKSEIDKLEEEYEKYLMHPTEMKRNELKNKLNEVYYKLNKILKMTIEENQGKNATVLESLKKDLNAVETDKAKADEMEKMRMEDEMKPKPEYLDLKGKLERKFKLVSYILRTVAAAKKSLFNGMMGSLSKMWH